MIDGRIMVRSIPTDMPSDVENEIARLSAYLSEHHDTIHIHNCQLEFKPFVFGYTHPHHNERLLVALLEMFDALPAAHPEVDYHVARQLIFHYYRNKHEVRPIGYVSVLAKSRPEYASAVDAVRTWYEDPLLSYLYFQRFIELTKPHNEKQFNTIISEAIDMV